MNKALYPSSKIDIAVENLMKSCGDFKGESGTEEFYHLLKQAVKNVNNDLKRSHRDGLCLDMVHALSSELSKLLDEANGRWN
jgi:hypothetical protein